MKTTTLSAAKERALSIEHLQKVVCVILKISTQQSNEHIYQAGLDYLRIYVPDAVFRAAIERSNLFWAWWRNRWYERDIQFANAREKTDTLQQLRENYLWHNNPRMLAGNIHPNAVVLNDSYSAMVGSVIKEEVQP